MYINDMPDLLSHSTPSLYADDTEICASSNDCVDLEYIDLENVYPDGCYKTSFRFTPVNRNICSSDLPILNSSDFVHCLFS